MWLSLNTLIHVVREDNTEVSLERKFEHEKCRCHTVEAFSHMERGKLDPFSGCDWEQLTPKEPIISPSFPQMHDQEESVPPPVPAVSSTSIIPSKSGSKWAQKAVR